MRSTTLLVSLLLVFAPVFAQNQGIDTKNSTIKFAIKNAGLTVEGYFSEFSGTLKFDETNISKSSFAAKILVKSLETGIDMRNEHLLEKEYFYADKYPNMSFESIKFLKNTQGYTVEGKLTIKDVTKLVSIPFTIAKSGTKSIFSGSLTINRRDYSVGGSSWIMADDVKIDLKIEGI